MGWFDVDKKGLEALLARKGKEFILFELLQNAWDEDVTKVSVTLEPVEGRPLARLVVEDDSPNGFVHLAHAYTLFAESKKKGDPTKRGRFNLGEKLVFACCESAMIQTTTGTIRFLPDGTRVETPQRKRFRGSRIECLVRMTREEIKTSLAAVSRLIPQVWDTTINGERLPDREAVTFFEASLPTEIADGEGNLKPAKRKCEVYVYDPLPGEKASIYEMGIPVVETGDRYHLDVRQKVPLTMDRDNVPPGFLQALRTYALNATSSLLTSQDATTEWVRAAAGDSRCEASAVTQVMDLRFGPKRVAYDMSDPEANKIATAAGYTVVHGGSLSGKEWDNVRETGAILPAGRVTPSRPEGAEVSVSYIPDEEWTPGMEKVYILCGRLGRLLMGVDVNVAFMRSQTSTIADYGARRLRFNVAHPSVGESFFDYPTNRAKIVDLIIHEFGHEYSGDHLSRDYYHALTSLAGKAVELALTKPEVFQ